ncbi:T9SS-dependent choice-of-anchor J family protein [Aurantibacillus circumpalustris]|uniref:T9SS-dependent choice-of-anchor J family protein n=1 Tax=Aurantibacillus circumpalustris TaxID=3036359 RepID=UPI00295A7645|nr:choice-of-anchor J domain-containing protein [Aurantibacillus circumpalustris]
MKRKITLLLIASASMFTMNSQVILSEDFTSPFNIGNNGWQVVDNTVPLSASSWTQGNQTGGNGTIPAYNGNNDDFYMADFTAVNGSAPGTISAFLITPTVTIYNGAILQFATRTLNQTAPNIYPDRLQVLMSQTGNTVIPTGPTNVGSFTDQLLDINPNLNSNNASAVSNGSVNGYPFAWTVYTLPISGVTGTVTGRFAFRYFVTNGGIGGVNSRLVGVDAVRYRLPCGVSVPSYTICSSGSATLNAIDGAAGYTYTWSPTVSNNSSVVVTPGSTSVYTLAYTSTSGTCPAVTSTVTIGSQLSIAIIASSSNTICSGTTVSLSAQSSATTYSWNTGATTSAITVTPNATTIYTVAGITGSLPFPSCYGANTIQIVVNASPTLAVALSPSVLCSQQGSITITASGADNYTYLSSSSNPQSIATPSAGAWNFPITGNALNGCSASGTVVFTVEPTPTVTATKSSPTVCTTHEVTLTANGADTYVWSGAGAGSTANPLTYSSSTTGSKIFTLIGTDLAGCTGSAVVSVNVIVCNLVGISVNNAFEETAIFPNPFTNEIKINVLDGNVVVYNALGQIVVNAAVHSSETINTSELPKGAYIVKAYNTNGELVKTAKLVKN